MPNLDNLITESRQRADAIDLQKQMLGAPMDDTVKLEATVPAKHNEDMNEGDATAAKAGVPNRRSEEELAAMGLSYDQIGKEPPQEHPLVSGVREAFKQAEKGIDFGAKVLGDPRTEAVGLGLTTGGVMTGRPELALPGLALLGAVRLSKGAKGVEDTHGLIRQRFQVEGIVDRALNPSPLAERVTNVVNEKTAVLSDEAAAEQAKALVNSGGVSRETLAAYAPGTSLMSAPHALAAQEIVTTESRAFIDNARLAIDTNNPQLADQALAQYARILDPASSYAGAVTTTAQTLRVASSEDIKALNLILERSSKTTKGMSPLEQLKYILADPATDPARQGKSMTQTMHNIRAQAQEVVATGNPEAAQVLINEVKGIVEEEAQLSMFVTEKEVTQAQKVIKSVTELHIKAANTPKEDAFNLKATGPHQPPPPKQTTFLLKPIKPGDQLTDDQLRAYNKQVAEQVAEAEQEKFRLTRDSRGAVTSKATQTDFLAQEERNKRITDKEHAAQAIRASTGESAFDKRKPFKLTAPKGGVGKRKPSQLDLLNLIAAEPQPEQLAIEMVEVLEVGNKELSKQLLSFITGAQKAIASGDTKKVGDTLARIQKVFDTKQPKVEDALKQPSRLVAQEKKAIQSFLMSDKAKGLSDVDLLKALLVDPSLQPEALINAINNAKNPTWRDAWQYLIINSMLTPASDFINFTATISMLPVHLAARTAGARAGQVARLMGGKAGVIIGEDEAMIHGLYAMFWDSVELSGRVLKTNHAEIGPAAIRETQLGQNPLSAEAVFGYSPTARKLAGITSATDAASSSMLSRAGMVSRAIDFVGVTTGLPGRLMLTGDQFVQSLAMAAEQHALVYRRAAEQAIREGLSEKEFYKAYRPIWRDVSKNLPAEIREKGEKFSLDVSLNTKLGAIGNSIMSVREIADKHTGIGGTITMPFFRTLVNGAKATWEMSPLGPSSQALGLLSKHFRDDMFGSDPVKRDIAVGKWAVGTMIMSSMVWAAVNGRLRGRGPDNKELRQQTIDAKGLTDSFVVNADDGTSIQINRMGVIGNLAGMAADAAEVWLQADDLTRGEIAQLLVTAYLGNLAFDFLQNSSGVFQALSNGVKRKADLDLLAKSLVNLIPLAGTGRQIEKGLATDEDPVFMKEARTTLEKILARFPGYDTLARKYDLEPVPVLRNQFGYAIKQPHSAWGTEWFNPLFVSKPSQQEGLAELAAIEIELGVSIQQPSRNIGNYNLPLSNEEYEKFQILAGEQWETRALAILPILRQNDIPGQVKKDLIETHVRLARQTAQQMLLAEEPDIVNRTIQQKLQLLSPDNLAVGGN
jgi:hypothetical protein